MHSAFPALFTDHRRLLAGWCVVYFIINGLLQMASAYVAPSTMAQSASLRSAAAEACPCTCCGDRCKMGALCCCRPVKPAPASTSVGLMLAAAACGPLSDPPLGSPGLIFLSYRFLACDTPWFVLPSSPSFPLAANESLELPQVRGPEPPPPRIV